MQLRDELGRVNGLHFEGHHFGQVGESPVGDAGLDAAGVDGGRPGERRAELAHVSRLGEAYLPNQSPNGLLHRLLGNGVSERWLPAVYPPYHLVVHAGTLVVSAGLLLAALWRPPPSARGGAMDLCAAMLATLLASPIAWEHHHGLLLPVFAVLLGLAMTLAGEAGRDLLRVFESANAVIMKLVFVLMQIAPYGIFCLIARVFAEQGFGAIRQYASRL